MQLTPRQQPERQVSTAFPSPAAQPLERSQASWVRLRRRGQGGVQGTGVGRCRAGNHTLCVHPPDNVCTKRTKENVYTPITRAECVHRQAPVANGQCSHHHTRTCMCAPTGAPLRNASAAVVHTAEEA